MRVSWWNGGIHIEAETAEEVKYLSETFAELDGVRIDHEIEPVPVLVVKARYE